METRVLCKTALPCVGRLKPKTNSENTESEWKIVIKTNNTADQKRS